ncbi:formimidoylglutamate deiminase [Sphingomonas adhaesiva]|uniref:formimidoylglutamate deiminase n=1 Tax=Sphingomonas adhaesiva TaxID=28212 RepID=UPI002FF8306C
MASCMWFGQALLPDGWARDVRIGIADGRIARIEADAPPAAGEARYATAVAGMPNLHSHAFQRLMAGYAEARSGPAGDDFWSWRDLMYRLVGAIAPDDLAGIAAMAFCEMLEGGFTRVGEFHYLHHAPGGTPFADPAEMAAAVASAAEATGIALTLLPVFYAYSGFGAQPPQAMQRRFVTDLDGYARLHAASVRACSTLPDAVVGVAPHSLRAVAPGQLGALASLAPGAPIHIHIAEQRREVADCVAWSGRRPVEWLLEAQSVDARWCLVHATHVTPAERDAIAAAGAVVGLCPVTEANLGDGIFPAEEFVAAGGRIGIGTDSNVRIDAAEELRTLEYGQRLTRERRTVLASGHRSTGRLLVEEAMAGGRAALGAGGRAALGAGGRAALGAGGRIAVGESADLVALRAAPCDAGDRALDAWVFARGSVDRVWRRGVEVVANGRHHDRDAIATRFDSIVRRLLA